MHYYQGATEMEIFIYLLTYKMCLLAYKALNDQVPDYLKDFFHRFSKQNNIINLAQSKNTLVLWPRTSVEPGCHSLRLPD